MKVELRLEEQYKEPKIIVCADRLSEEMKGLLERLARWQEGKTEPELPLTGTQGGALRILEETEILRVYASAGKVYAVTDDGEYTLRVRLYELEERLDSRRFVRISNAEIINLRRVREFELRLTGTIGVRMENGDVTYVSRRYVKRIREKLGM